MKIYTLKRTQNLPITVQHAWDFFSSPGNLGIITPKKMNFKIIHMSGGDKIFAGQIIRYKVTVLPFIRLGWVTEITHVVNHDYFTDEQLSGPYKLWHHTHQFKTIEGGVEMTDELFYALPLGILGRFAHWLFVAREVNNIFEYRYKILEKHFEKK